MKRILACAVLILGSGALTVHAEELQGKNNTPAKVSDEKEVRPNCQYITTGFPVEAVVQENGKRRILLENASTRSEAEQIIAEKVQSQEYLDMLEEGFEVKYEILPYSVYIVAVMDEKEGRGVLHEKRQSGSSVWLVGPTNCGELVPKDWKVSKSHE